MLVYRTNYLFFMHALIVYLKLLRQDVKFMFEGKIGMKIIPKVSLAQNFPILYYNKYLSDKKV